MVMRRTLALMVAGAIGLNGCATKPITYDIGNSVFKHYKGFGFEAVDVDNDGVIDLFVEGNSPYNVKVISENFVDNPLPEVFVKTNRTLIYPQELIDNGLKYIRLFPVIGGAFEEAIKANRISD